MKQSSLKGVSTRAWSRILCSNPLRVGLVVLALLFVRAPGLRAQATADILGTVTDASGGVVPGATVTLTNVGTNITSVAKTSSGGDYIFPGVQLGAYTVRIDANGFKTFAASPFTVAAGDRVRVNAVLQVGAQTTTVTVSGVTPALHTSSGTVSSTLTAQSVENLPVVNRNITTLVWLTPGATPTGSGLATGNSPDDRRLTSEYSVNGLNSFSNSYLIDGMDDNEVLIATEGVKPSVDAIQEVDVVSNPYTAIYTKAGGAVTNLITKSGTNDFHGDVFEFLRNSVLDANPNHQFPSNLSGCSSTGTGCTVNYTPFQTKPAFRYNDFGASLGGPIRKNKTFFFGDYEGVRQALGLASVVSVPTKCNRGLAPCPDGLTQLGDFSDQPLISPPGGGPEPCVQNGTTCPYVDVPASSINPIGLAYFSMYPLPNAPGIANNYVSNPTKTQNSNNFDVRIDQHFSDNDTLFGRYSFNNIGTVTPSSSPVVKLTSTQDPLITSGSVTVNPGIAAGLFGASNSFPGPNHTREQNLALSYTHIVSPNLLFTGTISYLRSLISSLPVNGASTGLAEALGFPCNAVSCVNTGVQATNGLPYVAPSGLANVGDGPFIPILYLDNTFEYRGAVTWTKGSQTIMAGVSLIRRRLTFGQSTSPRGGFAFTGEFTGVPGADLLEGLSDGGSGIGGTRALTLVQPGLRSWEPGAYFQDDWRVTRSLTLNLGIRYDIFTPYTERDGRIANWDPSTGYMVSPAIAGPQQSDPHANIRTDMHNVAPRIGFAVALPRKMVVRGGFGLVFFQDNIGSTSSLINPPFAFNFTCRTQNVRGTNSPCSAPFANSAVADYGPAPTVPNSTVGQTGGALLSAGIPAPVFNITQVLAPASCPITASPTSSGCTAAGGNNYATFSPSNVFLPNFPDNYVKEYSLEVQKQVGENVLSVGYVGNTASDLRTTPYNPTTQPNPSAPTNPLALAYPWLARESFGIQNKFGSSWYNSLQATFVRRFSRGLTVNANYTWSHSIWNDQGACQPVISFSKLGYGNAAQYEYPCYYDNPKNHSSPSVVQSISSGSLNSGNSSFDVRQRIAWAISYNLPFGSSATGFEGELIKGWSLNTDGWWQTGLPYTVTNGVSGITGVGSSGRPDQICSGAGNHSELLGWINPNCFVLQTLNTFGNEEAFQLFGPHQTTVNFGLLKTFKLTERLGMQFRAEAYNLFNRPNFSNPSSTTLGCYGTACSNTPGSAAQLFNPHNPTALQPGTITSLANSSIYGARDFQFALKLLF